MIRILFLDDDKTRHEAITRAFVGTTDRFELVKVKTAAEAIKRINAKEFDIIMLDHDLGGQTFVPSVKPDTGYTVACHLENIHRLSERYRTNPPENRNTRPYVIVHTMNVVGGINMMKALSGYRAVYIPFEPESLLYACREHQKTR